MSDALDEVRRWLGAIDDPVALLQGIFAFSPVAFQIYTVDGRCLLTNPAFRELFGSVPPPEYNIFEDEIAAAAGLLEHVRRAFRGETVQLPPFWYDPRELRHVRVTEGKRVAISSTFFPLSDRAGHVVHVAIVFKDETEALLAREVAEREHAEAESQRSRLHDLFMQAPVAIAIQEGPEHRYVLANSAYRQFLGGLDITGKARREVLPDQARLSGILDEVYASGATFSRQEFPFKVMRPGMSHWVDGYFSFVCQATRDPTGRVDGVITFAIEVTAQVESRQRIEQLLETMAEWQEELQLSVRARDVFLSIASHELRTPLTTLQLQVDALLRALGRGALDVEQAARAQRRAETIQHQGERLTRLVNQLLDVSRIAAGRMKVERDELDLAEVVRQIAGRLDEDLRRARATLVLHADVPVRGRWDRLRIDEVVSNLLSNALKYGAGEPIEVTVSAEGGRARLVVRDHGIGIDPVDQARIFDRFERAVSERHYGGFGLGLWIARQVVEAHGGTISVDSQPGKGSTFTVELPLESV